MPREQVVVSSTVESVTVSSTNESVTVASDAVTVTSGGTQGPIGATGATGPQGPAGNAFFERDRTVYVSKEGNDSNTGRSPADPLLTIQAAVDKFVQDGVVFVGGGYWQETVTCDNPGTRIVGVGQTAGAADRSTIIAAPTFSASALVVAAERVQIENLTLTGKEGGTYTGTVVDDQADKLHMRHVIIQGGDNAASATAGGVGLHLKGEGGTFDGVYIRFCSLGLKLDQGGTENVFTQLRGDSNWRDLEVVPGTDAGSNVFVHAKFVNGKCPAADGYVVDINNDQGQVFIHFDFEESVTITKSRIKSHNKFYRGIYGNAGTLEVVGDHNLFDHFRFIGPATISGDNNDLRHPDVWFVTLTLSGTGIVIDRENLAGGGAVSFGTALRPVYENADGS